MGETAYGACYNTDEEGNFDYLAGIEVRDFSDVPEEFATFRVPAQRYAVFRQNEHISTIRRTFAAIWSKWLPESGREVELEPRLVEQHLERPRLPRHLEAAPGEDQRALRRRAHAARIPLANRFETAAIVRLGLTPTDAGMTEPSAT